MCNMNNTVENLYVLYSYSTTPPRDTSAGTSGKMFQVTPSTSTFNCKVFNFDILSSENICRNTVAPSDAVWTTGIIKNGYGIKNYFPIDYYICSDGIYIRPRHIFHRLKFEDIFGRNSRTSTIVLLLKFC